jgi:dolichyl-diphosphooligosaccharide--protein glycosyltransferase
MKQRGRRCFVAALVLVVVLGTAVRLSVWRDVFTASGVRLTVDTDANYHVLRAERLLHRDPTALWFDRGMNFPEGARILWPPGFDLLLSKSTAIVAGDHASRSDLERVSAVVPVALAALTLMLLAWSAARWVGRRAAIFATFLAAILPMAVWWGLLGRADHHVAELLIFWAILFAFERAARSRRRGVLTVILGVLLAGAPWVWQGAALYVLFLAAFAAIVWTLRPGRLDAEARSVAITLACGSALGAVLLGSSFAIWPPPDALHPSSLTGMSAFHPFLLLCAAAFGGFLHLADRQGCAERLPIRLGVVAVSALIPAVLVVLLFPLPLHHGLRTAGATDPFWRTVEEVQPLLFNGRIPLRDQFVHAATFVGPVLLAPLAAIPAFRRRWRTSPQARLGLALLAVGAVVFVPLAIHSQRFLLYMGPFSAVAGGLLVADIAATTTLRGWRFVLAGLLMLVLAYPGAASFQFGHIDAVDADLLEIATWLAPRASSDRAVLAPLEYGHAVRYYSGAPVVITPFGTDIGSDGMRDFAAFVYAPTSEAAEEVARRRRVGWILFGDPLGPVTDALPFAPTGTAPLTMVQPGVRSVRNIRSLPGYEQGIASWLFDFDGVPEQFTDQPAIGWARLIYETKDRGNLPLKLFEIVAGARLELSGAKPGERVSAHTTITSNQGRRFAWWTVARADGDGRAVLRIPFATGMNGAVRAGEYEVRAGDRRTRIAVSEAAVTSGASLACDAVKEGRRDR